MTVYGPSWIMHYKTESGQDALGIRAVATNILSYLLPGIITITPRARYYAFYAWLLVDYGVLHPEGMLLSQFIKRREQIFGLANIAWYAETGQWELGLAGSEKLSAHWAQHVDGGQIPLNRDDYLRAKRGGYNQYSGVMPTLELTGIVGRDKIEILPKGQRLAKAFQDAIVDTRYYQGRSEFDTAETISVNILREYGKRCCLSGLAQSPDALPTLDVLFAFDKERVLPDLESDPSTVTNMKGSLGIILEILDQVKAPLDDTGFREAAAYGLCDDYGVYRPSAVLEPFVAHWQMFQLRGYYDYAIYAMWSYFLYWLRVEGPSPILDFTEHLETEDGLTTALSLLSLDAPDRPTGTWCLSSWYEFILDTSGAPDGPWMERCLAFSRLSQGPLSEASLWRQLEGLHPEDGAVYFTIAALLLSTLYLRLSGLRETDEWGAWHWARAGGSRRRSMSFYVQTVDRHRNAGNTLSDQWMWLVRDYLVAQHTIAALEKWQQRKFNTFHFSFEQGVFDWLADDATGFSASRFRQAYDMLRDLGLYEEVGEGALALTSLGRATLERVREACCG